MFACRKSIAVHIDFQFRCIRQDMHILVTRSLAHELGEKLKCGAHLRTLHRTDSGDFNIKDAIKLEELLELPDKELTARVITLLELTRILQPK